MIDPLTGEPDPEGGFTWGDFEINTCEIAVTVLNKSSLDLNKKGKPTKTANDAAYNLATALLAAQLNFSAGAGSCPQADTAAAEGLALLIEIGFNATGNYLEPAKGKGADDPDRAYALELQGILDAYNNNDLCPYLCP